MTIEVITPVCCSDGVTLNKKEYLYDNKKRKIYLLHKLEFGKYLNGRRWLNNFERYMQGKEHDEMSLYEWLQCMAGHKGVTIEQLGKAVLATVDVQVEIKRNGEGKPVNDMNPTIHLVDGNVYIPGSTIKGMLRTAILFHLIRQKDWEDRRKIYWRQIQSDIKNLYENRRNEYESKKALAQYSNTADKIEKELLSVLKLDTKEAASNDALRGLRCGDATLIEHKQGKKSAGYHTVILKKKDIKDDTVKEVPSFFECILPGTSFQFSLTLEKSMLAKIGITSVDDLLNIMQQFYEFLNDTLRSGFSKRGHLFAKIDRGNAYLGRNTGFLQKTFVLALADTPKDAVPIIKTVLHQQFEKHKYQEDKKISPHTLKGVEYNSELQLMGGVKIFDAH